MNKTSKISSILADRGLKKYLYNTNWLLFEKIARGLAELSVGIWLARYLGPEDFGIINISLAVFILLNIIAKLGLEFIVIREIVEENYTIKELLGTAFYLRVLSATILFLLFLFFYSQYSFLDHDNEVILIVCAGIFFQSSETVNYYFQAKVLSKFYSLAKIIQLIISTTIKIIMIVWNRPLIEFAFVILLDYILLSITISMFAYISRVPNFIHSFNKTLSIYLLRNSLSLMLGAFAVIAYMRIDQIMIKVFISETSVGIYSASVQICEAFFFIPMIISGSLFPAILNAKDNVKKYKYRLQNLFDLMSIISIPMTVFMILFSQNIILFLYGENFRETSNVLSIAVLVIPVVFLGVARAKWIISENLQNIGLMFSILGLILNITLNMLLIPQFGLVGAAIATVVSQISSNFIFPYFFPPTRETTRMMIISLNVILSVKRIIFFFNNLSKYQ